MIKVTVTPIFDGSVLKQKVIGTEKCITILGVTIFRKKVLTPASVGCVEWDNFYGIFNESGAMPARKQQQTH